MRKHHAGFLLVILSVVMVMAAACAPKPQPSTPTAEPIATLPFPTPTLQTIQLKDGLGNLIELDHPAQRIVSLAPSNTEILFAIGAGTQVVGRDSFSDYPTEAQQIKDIGGGFSQLNTEEIVALQPDLVLASALSSTDQVKALQDLGLKVFYLANPTDFDGLYINLLTVATLTGRTKEAQELINSLKNRVQAVETKMESVETRPLVFYELDSTQPDAPWTAGPNTFIDTLIGMSGGTNFGHELKGDWVQVSIEELLRREPDLILLGDATWGGVTPEAVATRPGWDKLKAVQNGQVFVFDDNLVSRPGPRLVDGLEAMAALIQPQLFPTPTP
ncbi:MAG: ABC transporter substrate-binding protein [Anaerolineales bacterium]